MYDYGKSTDLGVRQQTNVFTMLNMSISSKRPESVALVASMPSICSRTAADWRYVFGLAMLGPRGERDAYQSS